jgi:tellurite resistance protein
MSVFTEDEGRTVRTAVFGAMVLVSAADPGAVDQESHAGIKAMARLSPLVREVVGAGRAELPEGSVSDVEFGVLEALRRAVVIVAEKAPGETEGFSSAVVAICREVAEADGRVADVEGVMVAKVEAALGGGSESDV